MSDPSAKTLQAASLVLLGLGLLIVYSPALHGAYLWDDDTHYTTNRVLEAGGLLRTWLGQNQPNYWPVTWTSFWLEHWLFGFSPLASHTTNVVLHAMNALLLGALLRRLRCPLPMVAALLFAFHPTSVESVAWVTQRKNLLCMFFALAASLHFVGHWEPDRRSRAWRGVGWFAASLLSKGAAIGLPLVFVLLLRWRRVPLDRRMAIQLAPYFAVSLLFGAIEILFMGRVKGSEAVFEIGLAERTTLVVRNLAFYLQKSVLPVDLVFVYPRWDLTQISGSAYAPLGVAALLLLVASALRPAAMRAAWTSGGVFLLMLFPALGIVDIYFFKYAYVADHYLYLAIPALAALVAGGLAMLPRVGATATAVVLCGVLAGASHAQSRLYGDSDILWRETLRRNPAAWMAHNQLGVSAQQRERFGEARSHFEAALALAPPHYDRAMLHLNLGNVLLLEGAPDQARPHFAATIDGLPDQTQAWIGLAATHAARNDHESLEATLHAALANEVDGVRIHALLAASLRDRGEHERAQEHIEEAARLQQARPTR